MQEFDYSNETSNDLYDAVDGLSYEEAVFAKEAIEKIKEEKEEKKAERKAEKQRTESAHTGMHHQAKG